MTKEGYEPEVAPVAAATAVPAKMVTVVAPSTLQAGYTFTAQIDGEAFTVTVPEGGVTEGQHFQVPFNGGGGGGGAGGGTSSTGIASGGSGGAIVSNPTAAGAVDLGAPKGRWRNDLCDCCEVCCCTGMCCNACCCTGIVVGQLAQRFHLSFCGSPSNDYGSTFNSWAVVWGIYIGLMLIGIGESLQFLVVIFLAFVLMNIRYNMRKTYDIPPSCCECFDGKCDDFMCSCCCQCCVSIQMVRHTHDYHQYPYQCCGPTGLPINAPECV